MTRIIIDADRPLPAGINYPFFDEAGALPRRTLYGRSPHLIPFGEAYPDKLVDPKDYKEVIAWCHERKIFPMYHQQATWGPPGFRWNQNGLNYCWIWSLAGAFMTDRAIEGKPTILLSPVSLGRIVNWKNAGNYLEDAVAGFREYGLCEMEFTPNQHSRSPKTFRDGWEANALQNRLGDTWDTPDDSLAVRIQYMISILKTGTAIYDAHNWWGHATSVVGVVWDESQKNNLRVIERNSHDEDDLIELTGDRAIPDEMIGICSSLTDVAA